MFYYLEKDQYDWNFRKVMLLDSGIELINPSARLFGREISDEEKLITSLACYTFELKIQSFPYTADLWLTKGSSSNIGTFGIRSFVVNCHNFVAQSCAKFLWFSAHAKSAPLVIIFPLAKVRNCIDRNIPQKIRIFFSLFFRDITEIRRFLVI